MGVSVVNTFPIYCFSFGFYPLWLLAMDDRLVVILLSLKHLCYHTRELKLEMQYFHLCKWLLELFVCLLLIVFLHLWYHGFAVKICLLDIISYLVQLVFRWYCVGRDFFVVIVNLYPYLWMRLIKLKSESIKLFNC